LAVGVCGIRTGDDEPDDPAGEEPVDAIAWHSDLTYTALPSRGALLYARVVPEEGGVTGWIDTASVYDALPESTKEKIAGLDAVHSLGPLQQAIKNAKIRSTAPTPKTSRNSPRSSTRWSTAIPRLAAAG